MPAPPGEVRLRRTGDIFRRLVTRTPSVRLPGDEIRAPTTLVEASTARSRTWVQFPPSPLISQGPNKREFGPFAGKAGFAAAKRRARKTRELRARDPGLRSRWGAACSLLARRAPQARAGDWAEREEDDRQAPDGVHIALVAVAITVATKTGTVFGRNRSPDLLGAIQALFGLNLAYLQRVREVQGDSRVPKFVRVLRESARVLARGALRGPKTPSRSMGRWPEGAGSVTDCVLAQRLARVTTSAP